MGEMFTKFFFLPALGYLANFGGNWEFRMLGAVLTGAIMRI